MHENIISVCYEIIYLFFQKIQKKEKEIVRTWLIANMT